MRRFALASPSGLIVAAAIAGLAFSAASAQSEARVKRQIIEESIAAYGRQCPCPYSIARDASSCGGRSAYSRTGGAAPVCFPSDISHDQVEAWRAAHR